MSAPHPGDAIVIQWTDQNGVVHRQAMLSATEQQEMFAAIKEIARHVSYLADQFGPKHPAWGPESSFGLNAQGKELTMRDGMTWVKREVSRMHAKLERVFPTTPGGTA